jgi:hypothetical protein
VIVFTIASAARSLTFEDCFKAQDAIARVYYSHQISANPFAEAVPREVLEKMVWPYLKQSVALERGLSWFTTGALVGVRYLCYTSAVPPVVGGPCRYTSYPGQARIVSVTPQVDDRGQSRYDVRFEFLPYAAVAEPFARPEGRTFALLVNGSRPDSAFLKKHQIRSGRLLPCTMKAIVKGACAPVVFEFAFDNHPDADKRSPHSSAKGS